MNVNGYRFEQRNIRYIVLGSFFFVSFLSLLLLVFSEWHRFEISVVNVLCYEWTEGGWIMGDESICVICDVEHTTVDKETHRV